MNGILYNYPTYIPLPLQNLDNHKKISRGPIEPTSPIAEHSTPLPIECNDLNLRKRAQREPDVKVIKMLNIGEPITEIILILTIIWSSELEISWWMVSSLLLLVIWMLYISPYIHYYILNEGPLYLPPQHLSFKYWLFQARGIGSPFQFYERQADGTLYFMHFGLQLKWFVILIISLLFGSAIQHEDKLAQFMLGLFGYTSYTLEIWGCFVFLSSAALILLFIVLPLFMRLDNFLPALHKYFLQLAAIALALIIIFGLTFQIFWDWWIQILGTDHRWSLLPPTPLLRIQKERFVNYFSEWVLYILWGWLQQVLFLGCFATQLSRGFEAHKSKSGKLYTCLLSALFFASMHIPAIWLAIATAIFGYLWAERFIETPNMAVFGINQGMLGSLVNQLLPINFTVGPSHLPYF